MLLEENLRISPHVFFIISIPLNKSVEWPQDHD